MNDMADNTGAPPPELELKNLTADFKKATDEVKSFAEQVQTEMKNLGKATDDTKTQADKALSEMNGISQRMTELEQKMTRRGGGDQSPTLKTLGQHVVESEAVKAVLQQKNGQARLTIELKDIMTGGGSLGTGVSMATSLTVPDRQPIVPPPMRQLVVRDLITPGTTTANAIEYPVETSSPGSTAAAVVSEGQRKPKTDITFDLKSVPVRTIAHWMKASRQIMDDVPQLQSYIDGRLRYGLGYVEETELLYGDGTGQHLLGIIPQASAYSAAFAPANLQNIDTLRLASLQATLAFYPATGYVLHPTDWAKIELTKDLQARYIVGDPQNSITPRLWNLPVVQTTAMQVSHFLTGAFRLGAQIFDRMSMEVLLSTENEDDFVRNMITIRAEERLALAVYRPQAFIYGSLS
jgi:HK97 family phage major capsid protein